MWQDYELKILEGALAHSESRSHYYMVMAILIIILVWGLYFALRRNGTLMIAVILSFGLWYYPWRYYQQKKAILLDLEQKTKSTIQTRVLEKYISKINRIEPYFYIETAEESFEVSKSIYDSIQEGNSYAFTYANHSKIILRIEPL